MKVEIEIDDRLLIPGYRIRKIGLPKKGEPCVNGIDEVVTPWIMDADAHRAIAVIYEKIEPPKRYRQPFKADIGKPCEVTYHGENWQAVYCGMTDNGMHMVLFDGEFYLKQLTHGVRIEVTDEPS